MHKVSIITKFQFAHYTCIMHAIKINYVPNPKPKIIVTSQGFKINKVTNPKAKKQSLKSINIVGLFGPFVPLILLMLVVAPFLLVLVLFPLMLMVEPFPLQWVVMEVVIDFDVVELQLGVVEEVEVAFHFLVLYSPYLPN